MQGELRLLGVVTHSKPVMPTRKRKLFIGTSRGGATVGAPDVGGRWSVSSGCLIWGG